MNEILGPVIAALLAALTFTVAKLWQLHKMTDSPPAPTPQTSGLRSAQQDQKDAVDETENTAQEERDEADTQYENDSDTAVVERAFDVFSKPPPRRGE